MTNTEDVRFAIVIATYRRKNGKTPYYLRRCLDSIVSQTHTNWDIFLIGDKYEPEEELLNLLEDYQKKLTRNQLFYHSNDVVERDVIKGDPEQLWCCAGANSMNIGLAFARRTGYKYYAHLDDDDYWEPNHLEEIAKVYAAYPKCVFVCTTATEIVCTAATVITAAYILPHMVSSITEVYENNLLPTPCSMAHSAFSFRIDIVPFYYRTNLNPIFNMLLGEKPIEAADAYMLQCIRSFIQDSNGSHTSVFVPKFTCYHDIEREDSQTFDDPQNA